MEEKDVLIIGGGISGITVALELAQSGIPSTLIERDPSLGGLSASFCCKASESCNKCFACVVDKRISEIQQRQDSEVWIQRMLQCENDRGHDDADPQSPAGRKGRQQVTARHDLFRRSLDDVKHESDGTPQ